ncbi:MAG: SEL1-like repeat protein [Hyphomicrobiales bacterium]
MAHTQASGVDRIKVDARSGAADALLQLGLMYSLGREVKRDLVAAHKWFNLAALRGNVSARTYRTEIASELSQGEVATAQRMARDWLLTV